ncbi:GreA/GreB family elongation factor [Paenibacillus ginsengarvi]|uniref:GreA/GreB family elongation factor n=1 Tax=Paenibacillus ginsengarvi TaxID=400777 RepID=A0A3B0CIF6_9BACL|nr:GreA/GreB family elongation factor [Paenibacillus ginsengarvi]RKN84354.1 GreA/GreB family elongation factor [Paenibacillus ginsengarvi]
MNPSFLQTSRSQLVNQLVFFDEEKTNFLNQYFPNISPERNKIDRMLSVYTTTLEQMFSDYSYETLNSIVLIGSEVNLKYMDDGSAETYTIVFPHQANLSQNRVSFLSPVGSQLLLTPVNETRQLGTPAGEIEVKLEQIRFTLSGEVQSALHEL